MKRMIPLAGLAAVALLTAATYMSVTFDAANGTGFVGKGDVQLAFSWNNKAAQNNTPGVSFTYESDVNYTWDCVWDTEAGQSGNVVHHEVARHRSQGVNGTVAYDPRVKKQITGYNLNGYSSYTETGGEGQEPNTCPMDAGDAVAVNQNVTYTTAPALYANFGASKAPIWFPI